MAQDSIQSTKFGLVDITAAGDGLNTFQVQQLINATLANAPSITTQILEIGTPSVHYTLPTSTPIGTQIIVNRLLPSITIDGTNDSIQYFFVPPGAHVQTISHGTYDLFELFDEIIAKTMAYFAGIGNSTIINWTSVGNKVQVTTTGGSTFAIVPSTLTTYLGQTAIFPQTNSYTFLGDIPAVVEWEDYLFAKDEVEFEGDVVIDGNLDVQGDITCTNIDMSGNIDATSGASVYTITKDNVDIDMDTDLISLRVAGMDRIVANDTISAIISPDGLTGIAVSDAQIVLVNSSGLVFYADPTQTIISDTSGATTLSLDSTTISANMPIVLPTNQLATNPDLQFSDSTDTGVYSPALNHVGITCDGTQVANFSPSDATSRPVLFTDGLVQLVTGSKLEVTNNVFNATIAPTVIGLNSAAAQTNVVLTRTNGTYSAPTKVVNTNNLGNIGCRGWLKTGSVSTSTATIQFQAMEDFNTSSTQGTRIQFSTCAVGSGALTTRATLDSTGLGINVAAPAARLDISGASGTTFKMVDTNQASGRVMVCDSAGVGSWTNPNSITFIQNIGYCYYEGAVGAGTAIAVAVSGTKYLVNLASTAVSLSNFSHNSLSRLTYTSGSTKIFKVNFTATIANDTGILPQTFYIWGYKNGALITGASCRMVTDMTTTNYYPVSLSFNVSLALNDYIECYISNEGGTIDPNIGTLQIAIN